MAYVDALLRCDLAEERADAKGRVDSLYEAIAHGDDEHRAWLREKLRAHFATS